MLLRNTTGRNDVAPNKDKKCNFKKKGTCHFFKKGHYIRECRLQKKKEHANNVKENLVVIVFEANMVGGGSEKGMGTIVKRFTKPRWYRLTVDYVRLMSVGVIKFILYMVPYTGDELTEIKPWVVNPVVY
jgi:hypothetical protein